MERRQSGNQHANALGKILAATELIIGQQAQASHTLRHDYWLKAAASPGSAYRELLNRAFEAPQPADCSQQLKVAYESIARLAEATESEWPCSFAECDKADFIAGYFSQNSKQQSEDKKQLLIDRRKQRPVDGSKIRDWFDPAQFIKVLDVYINQMFGGRWMAFSMPDGRVYVQSSVLVDMIRNVGRKRRASDIDFAITDDELKRTVVYQAFIILRDELNAIDCSLLNNGDFSARFDVTLNDGTIYRRCTYIPFRSEVFGALAELEARKYGKVATVIAVERC